MRLVFDEGKMESCPEDKDQAEDELDENSVATNDDNVKQRAMKAIADPPHTAKFSKKQQFESSVSRCCN